MRVFATPIVILFLFAAVPAQQSPAPVPVPVPAAAPASTPETKAIAPLTVVPGEMDVQKLVELIGRYARCNILCDPAELGRTKTISLTEPVQLDLASCLETLSSRAASRSPVAPGTRA